jgi:hypothetical protein
MSENYRYYAEKLAESKADRERDRPLADQLDELLQTVRRCEEMWALEERIERS